MKLKFRSRKNSYTGFSMLEILISMVIATLLIGVVLQNYLSAKKNYSVQMELNRANENLRFADFILRSNIMHAGFSGCRKISELELINHTKISFDEFNVIRGYDSIDAPSYLLDKKIVFGTDAIVITKASADITDIVERVKVNDTFIKVEQTPVKESNRFLLISDCKNAELFIAKNWSNSTISSKTKFRNSYQTKNTSVSRFEEIAFFISTTRVTDQNKRIYGLYFSTNGGIKQELIPEISDMQIVYGIDSYGKGTIDKYLRAKDVTYLNLWHRVLGVIITLRPQNRLLSLGQWKIYIKLRERGCIGI